MCVFHILFMVRVNPFCIFVCFLIFLYRKMSFFNLSKSFFQSTIFKDLSSSNSFKLHSVQFVFICILLFHDSSFSYLLGTFKFDCINLLLVHTFKVIWFDSMSISSQHTGFSCLIFSHEIMIKSKFNFMLFLSCPHIMHCLFFSFLLGM